MKTIWTPGFVVITNSGAIEVDKTTAKETVEETTDEEATYHWPQYL